jgi:hypothetical protein
MSGQKPQFGASELSPTYVVDEEGEQQYSGPERREGNRRSGKDRREEVRFEVDKEDRRQRPGRRKGDKSPKFW